MKRFIAVLCLLSATTSWADADNVVLSKGSPAPFDGILLPMERAQRVHLMDLDLQTCTKVSGLKDEENKVLMDRINNANAEVKDLSERYARQKDSSFWERTGYFLLGAGLTGLVAYGAARAVK